MRNKSEGESDAPPADTSKPTEKPQPSKEAEATEKGDQAKPNKPEPQDDTKTVRDLLQKDKSIKDTNPNFQTDKTQQRLKEMLKQHGRDRDSIPPGD